MQLYLLDLVRLSFGGGLQLLQYTAQGLCSTLIICLVQETRLHLPKLMHAQLMLLECNVKVLPGLGLHLSGMIGR